MSEHCRSIVRPSKHHRCYSGASWVVGATPGPKHHRCSGGASQAIGALPAHRRCCDRASSGRRNIIGAVLELLGSSKYCQAAKTSSVLCWSFVGRLSIARASSVLHWSIARSSKHCRSTADAMEEHRLSCRGITSRAMEHHQFLKELRPWCWDSSDVVLVAGNAAKRHGGKIGRASCRERVSDQV